MPELEQRRLTADEVVTMIDAGILSEDEPVELIDGRLVVASPQGPVPSDLHSEPKGDDYVLRRLVEDGESVALPGMDRTVPVVDLLP